MTNNLVHIGSSPYGKDGTACTRRAQDHRWPMMNRCHLWMPYLMAAVIMYALKKYYSLAAADQLRWILQPVGYLVACWDTLPYTWESGVGFVRADQFITIAPACSGVNFLIMAYGLTSFAFLHHQRTLRRRLLWLSITILGAYGLTVAVNAVRISLAIALYEADVAWRWLTPERLHRIAGIAVYFTALGLYYMILHRIIAGSGQGPLSFPRIWLPWIWYICGAVVVPVLHQAYHGHGWSGWEYSLTVFGVSSLIFGSIQGVCVLLE